jgi:elongation factor 1-gamma
VDYINSTIAPLSNSLSQQVFGNEESDQKTFSIDLNNLKRFLGTFEKHLALRNFLVGYAMTLADVTLVVHLIVPLQTVFDSGYRKTQMPNLSRYASIILDQKAFSQVFGRVHFCKKLLQPMQPKAAQAPKEEKKEKKKAEAKTVKPVETAPAEPNWEALLPEVKDFDFYEFKSLMANSKDKVATLREFWPNFNKTTFSLWFVHYEKCEGEGLVAYQTNNQMNGFIQRIDDKIRKHTLGSMGVYGEEPSLEIKGVFMWRGTGIIHPMNDHPQFEYYKRVQLNPEVEADRKVFEEYFARI